MFRHSRCVRLQLPPLRDGTILRPALLGNMLMLLSHLMSSCAGQIRGGLHQPTEDILEEELQMRRVHVDERIMLCTLVVKLTFPLFKVSRFTKVPVLRRDAFHPQSVDIMIANMKDYGL